MDKKGYALYELVILIVGLGLIMLIVLPKMSQALVDHKEEYYASDIALYLRRAKDYGTDHIEEIKAAESYVITIKELVDAQYLISSVGDIKDPRDGSSMMTVKILLQYEEETHTVKASLAS